MNREREKESQNERYVSSPELIEPLSEAASVARLDAKSTPDTLAKEVQQTVRISAKTDPKPTRQTR